MIVIFSRILRSIFRLAPVWFVFLTIVLSVFPRCANIVPPRGGPRDSIPPVLISSTPPLYSTNVSPVEISLVFDEFIELRSLQQQLLISPPQKERPEIRHRGKTLSIKFNDELFPNTTYTINFGNAIVDLNEANALNNFEFVFSTGPSIDSLAISGKVVNAQNNNPEENVVVMLYTNLQDSVPMKEIPVYASRTNKEGFFRLRHLRADTFKMFALKDINNNFLYDRPGNEAIAFPDSLIFLSPPQHTHHEKPGDPISDVRENLSEQKEHDSLRLDCCPDTIEEILFLLRLFTEDVRKQYVSSATRPDQNRLLITFHKESENKPLFSPLNFDPETNWSVSEYSPKNDSVYFWLTDSLIFSLDTIRLAVEFFDTRPDSNYLMNDTLRFVFSARTVSGALQKQGQRVPDPVVMNVKNRDVFPLGKKITFSARNPLASVDTSLIRLAEIIDSIPAEMYFVLRQDLQYPRKLLLDVNLNENSKFELSILPGAFVDIFGNQNDSLRADFSTARESEAGTLFLKLENFTGPHIIQLLDEKDNPLQEKHSTQDTLLVFNYLKPQRYKVRAVVDKNGNGKWDPGYYLLAIQPEEIIFFREQINIRAAWDTELIWNKDQ